MEESEPGAGVNLTRTKKLAKGSPTFANPAKMGHPPAQGRQMDQ